MNKTIYIRDEDTAVWDRAKELAGEKLAPVIVEGLKRFIAESERKEAEQKGFERIEYEYPDADANGYPRRKAFVGKWIFPPDNVYVASGPIEAPEDLCWKAVVAVTAKGAVVVSSWTETYEGRSNKRFRVYPSFEEGALDTTDDFAVIAARAKLGVPVEELDI